MTMSAACSTTTGSSAVEPSLVRASTSSAETVGVEEADLYRAREVAGVVEQRAERALRSAWTGRFTRAPGIRKGGTVRTGARVGTVRVCVTATQPGAQTSGESTPATAADPAAVATPTCHAHWHVVRAAVAGTITALTGEQVMEGADVVRIRPPGYVIRATVTDPAAMYDLMRPPPTGKTRILGGPAGFTVRYEGRTYDPADGSVVLLLAVPGDVAVVEGLRTSTAFVVSRRSDVPTLPVTAVQGTTGVGQVVVVDADRRVVTPVKLGQHDGSRVEVTGLPVAARVLRFPLASDFLAAP
jgi:hypothetical protein